MIEEVPAPGKAIGWRLSGRISPDDYAAVDERLATLTAETDGRVSVLCIVDGDTDWGIDALVADSRLARYTFRIGRVAVVGAPSWSATLVFLADHLPGWNVRHFAPSSRAAAERWLAIESDHE